VVGSGKGELEIPYAEEFLSAVKLDHKRIEMLLPAGLLEINAPLSQEEKKQLEENMRERESSKRRAR
jgi:16S rRNA processing protein RimM